MPKPIVDITGRRFGRLTVLQLDHKEVRSEGRGSRIFWCCLCDCGEEAVVSGDKLKGGHSQSCGCLREDVLWQTFIKHGHALAANRHTSYICWANMRQRCENPKHPKYPHYGGRGITVCERWRDYQNFFADVGGRPPGMSLDRIDVNGHYEPGNVRWATAYEQANNKQKSLKE